MKKCFNMLVREKEQQQKVFEGMKRLTLRM